MKDIVVLHIAERMNEHIIMNKKKLSEIYVMSVFMADARWEM
jgi:hypothetical protein